jgi:transcription elongation factor GreA
MYLTKKGKDQLIRELQYLKIRKALLKEEIANAIEFGDIRENAEYHAAKESLENLLYRMNELRWKIDNAIILDNTNIDITEVHIGVRITIQDQQGTLYCYTIVDPVEADPTINKISSESPLTRGLLYHKVGDICKIVLPIGETIFKIVKIEPAT